MKISSSQELGQAIRLRRKSLHVTQKDLALTAGTGLRFIIDLERGKPTCHIQKALSVVQALGVKINLSGVGDES
ncbi:MAG: helix-turn-helix transcriptional regulator [Planctomycetes bacterium]|nr:helix-turn-helix transcriptional regulator [Planctomycetota bacterium]